jgi:hypothetical protein
MLAEFVNRIAEMAKGSEAIQTVQVPGGNLLVRHGSDVSSVAQDRKLDTLRVSDRAGLLNWCQHTRESDENASELLELSIVVRRTQVLATKFPGLWKAEQCQWLLNPSAAVEALTQWVAEPCSLKQVVRMLRTDLSGTFTGDYLSVFRRLDFSRKNDGTRSVSHKGESLGRSIEAVAQSSAGDIPELLVFTVPLWNNCAAKSAKLTFALEVDASTELLSINVVSDCVASAYIEAGAELVGELQKAIPEALVVAFD